MEPSQSRVRRHCSERYALRARSAENPLLLQLRVLRLGLLEDGDAGIGVFPEREEILVGQECPGAGSIGVHAPRGLRF
jgi:hypothetical protein